MPPVRTTIRSPGIIEQISVNTCVPSISNQTLSTLKLIAEAKSATDFLCVHSSRISPSRNINMTEPAVLKSPRTIDTVTAVPSNTATDKFPCKSAERPSLMYFNERTTASAEVIDTGRNKLDIHLRITVTPSLSSNSRLSALEVCSGTRFIFSALSKAKFANARIMFSRFVS